MSKQTRPTKKQFETLEYIRSFISEHGYSPSYREIMGGCNYTSVATVALHVKNLIARGHLVKRDKSARSLEVVGDVPEETPKTKSNELTKAIESRITTLESSFDAAVADEAYILLAALSLLGHSEAARAYKQRITSLQ